LEVEALVRPVVLVDIDSILLEIDPSLTQGLDSSKVVEVQP
jgi:hypothetical protein